MQSAARPSRGLLVFDGDCGFCTTTIRWSQHVLPAFPDSTPYQWVELGELGLTLQDATERVWFVTDTHVYGGHEAVTAVLRRQPTAALRMLGWLGTVPPWSWAARAGYSLMARYRYLLPGGTPACQLNK